MSRALANSILPLNKDGSIYHLRIKPGELANTIILVGDPERVPWVSQHFSTLESVHQHREFTTHTGLYNNRRLSVISTGIGTGNVDIIINELDALKNIDFKRRTINEHPTSLQLIRLGTCGALQERLEPDQMILSYYAAGFDGLLHYYDNACREQHPLLSQAIEKRLTSNMLQHNLYIGKADPQLHRTFNPLATSGITLTCPGFYGPQNRRLRIPLNNINLFKELHDLDFDQCQATNFEMETAMLYGLSTLLGHQAISISTVVYNRVTEAGSKNPSKAINEMIAQALQLL